jgi:hypothetical protein
MRALGPGVGQGVRLIAAGAAATANGSEFSYIE